MIINQIKIKLNQIILTIIGRIGNVLFVDRFQIPEWKIVHAMVQLMDFVWGKKKTGKIFSI